jgi:hypothetical protein
MMEGAMEWIILVVLVPAVIVPVVLLFGFAGCAQLAGIEEITIVPAPGTPQTAGRRGGADSPALSNSLKNPMLAVAVQLTDSCLVQRFPNQGWGSHLGKIVVTVRSKTDLTITRAFVSSAATVPYPDSPVLEPWDSASDNTAITTTAFPLKADVPRALPETTYYLSDTDDLLVAFDVSTGTGLRLTKIPSQLHRSYIKSGVGPVGEAGPGPNRSHSKPVSLGGTGEWEARDHSVVLIEKIEFLTTA